VWKPAEAGYHIPVCHRVVAKAGHPFSRIRVAVFKQAVKTANARFLRGEIFGMFIGDVQKDPVYAGELAVSAAGNG
jgi:hypothetical protein